MKKRFFSLFTALLSLCAFSQNVFAQSATGADSVSHEDVAATVMGLVMIAVLAILPLLFFGIFFLLVILSLVLWIWMIVDAAKNEKDDDLLVWILILVFVQGIGAIIYYFVRKRPRDNERNQREISVTN